MRGGSPGLFAVHPESASEPVGAAPVRKAKAPRNIVQDANVFAAATGEKWLFATWERICNVQKWKIYTGREIVSCP